MKVILVDDERLALIGLRKSIERELDGVEVVATYSDSTEVMTGVLLHRPDVVFLDIHMPEIDGLDLGRQIQAAAPGVEIIFVTSYDQYAVRAFELYALDYIMKPIQQGRLRQTLLRVNEKLKLKRVNITRDIKLPLICCFNQIRFKLPGMDAQTVKWRTSKAQELFAYLLHHRNQMVYRSTLLELLWPEFEESKVQHQLYTTIYHVRRTLKAHHMDMITIRSGDLEAGYRLETGDAQLDTELWESEMRQWKVVDDSTAEAFERVLRMYEGTYLGNYEYVWAEHERERLRYLWLYHMRQLSDFYEQRGMQRKAIEVAESIQNMLPHEEESYFALMRLYDSMNEVLGVEEQYRLLTSRMEQNLDMPVSENIKEWYHRWKSGIPIT
ncbi:MULTISPECIES: response regulator [Paenibacillus]|uniref:Histidine kinase n=1 Tax=Paenibacillus taichungensis TaxID=484184 RepID=A0A329QZR3_9BACL|nr:MULTISPECIES: response regulator [Paenibacillus]RAW16148.1 histidine kinase [Paenibacillus taichungensis]